MIFPPEKVEDGLFVSAVLQSSEKSALSWHGYWRYTGTLITDLFAEVERAENFARPLVA